MLHSHVNNTPVVHNTGDVASPVHSSLSVNSISATGKRRLMNSTDFMQCYSVLLAITTLV